MATKVAGVDVSLGMDVTAPLVFTVGLGDWPLSEVIDRWLSGSLVMPSGSLVIPHVI